MNKFFGGLFVGALLGTGGTVAFIMRSQTVKRVVHEEIVARVSAGMEAFLYGPPEGVNPEDYETFVDYKRAREAARTTPRRRRFINSDLPGYSPRKRFGQ